MIFFGHIGLTLAITRTLDKTINNRNSKVTILDIDYRLIILGSMLPDIIDKGILLFLFGKGLSYGRLLAHSLLFTLLLSVLGMAVLYFYRKSWVIALAICFFIHQMLDAMWNQFNIFLWPAYNFSSFEIYRNIEILTPRLLIIPLKVIQSGQIELTWKYVINTLFDPYVYISEMVGLIILLYFIFILIRRKQFIRFIKTGKFFD